LVVIYITQTDDFNKNMQNNQTKIN